MNIIDTIKHIFISGGMPYFWMISNTILMVIADNSSNPKIYCWLVAWWMIISFIMIIFWMFAQFIIGDIFPCTWKNIYISSVIVWIITMVWFSYSHTLTHSSGLIGIFLLWIGINSLMCIIWGIKYKIFNKNFTGYWKRVFLNTFIFWFPLMILLLSLPTV